MNICIWCREWERVIGSVIFRPEFKDQVKIYIHSPCMSEFMGTLIGMARREYEEKITDLTR